MNYYNDNDPKCAAWLRELIRAGEIPNGDVDERGIEEVEPHELDKYTQKHFFAGIGGWPYALRLAGWPEDEEVWTGSCPCQPLSCAGNRKGHADKRHLWPAFYALIAKCKPATIFGEQVAGTDGCEWLAGVRADLEGAGYAIGAANLCAAGVVSPHIRQRLYWVAKSKQPGRKRQVVARSSPATGQVNGCSSAIGMGFANGSGRDAREPCSEIARHRNPTESTGSWSDFDIVHCLDGKSRRIESGTFPLAHGVPNRVGLLRGYGNAIVPPLAAEFIQASVLGPIAKRPTDGA